MAATGIGFRWLDILEKEFDKACVELDTSLTEVEGDEPEVVFAARQKIASLGSCFAQLTHKALTIFQNSAKIEAELVDMRAELVQARAAAVVVAAGQEARGADGADGACAGGAYELRARSEAAQLARENAALRETVLALHSELFGARLATKYLDKELAGRIQQLQLLGRDMRAELRDSLWAQVEAEILLQRHKTLVRVCRGLQPCPPRPPRSPPRGPARPRTVRVRRSPHLGLGISITGGREHGVPILISELEAGGPAALTGALYVGDAILAINDVDLTQACHKEAVAVLQSVKGDCALCVQFVATDDEDHLSDDHYRFPLYPEDGEIFGGEGGGSGATPTAPRTPEFNRDHSEAGSRSECESPRYAEVPYRPPPVPYPDYNAINNNLSILDMDDDSIKIETEVEPVKIVSPPPSPTVERAAHLHRHLGRYRGLPGDISSSNDSPHSTPVHNRRPNLKKKKVKPLDWRSKGAYRAVDDEVHSSDEVQISPLLDPSLANERGISTVFTPVPVEANEEDVATAPQEYVEANGSAKEQASPETSDLSPPERPVVPLPPPQKILLPAFISQSLDKAVSLKPNGVDSKISKNRAFRIGSAKRVSEGIPTLTNGNSIGLKCSHSLLSGDGDPDFGTPV